jgi:hypothetical protein
MGKRALAVWVAGGVACLWAACASPRLNGYAGYAQTRLQGDVGLASGSSVTADVDVEDDLGLEKSGSPYARLEAGLGPFGLTASALHYDSAENGVLTVDFGNIIVGGMAAVAVHTDAELFNAKAALTIDVVDVGGFRLSPGVGVDYIDMDVRVSAPLGAFDEIDVQAPVPMLFLQAAGDVGPVAATVDFGGMSIDLPDAEGTFLDIEALVRVQPVDHLELIAGYRWIHIDADGVASGQAFDADLALHGWLVGGGITF